MSKPAFCCHAECNKDAEWEIMYGPTVDDFTQACTVHVGELLEPNVENTVYPVPVKG